MKLNIQLFGGRGASSSNGSVYNSVLRVEQARKGLTREELSIYSKDGKLLLEMQGEDNHVDARQYRDLMENAIVTHNHPMNDNFSSGDIDEFVNSNLYELRASTNDKTYIIRKTNAKGNSKIKEDYNKVNSESWNYASQKLQEKAKNNTLGYNPRENPARYNKERQLLKAEYKSKWLKENAKKYGYTYSEKKI